MKIKNNMFEVELNIYELKAILRDGYLSDALSHAQRYLRIDETLESYEKEAQYLIDTESDPFVLWDKLRESMPKGSKKSFLQSELKKLKIKIDKDFNDFSKHLLDNVEFYNFYPTDIDSIIKQVINNIN